MLDALRVMTWAEFESNPRNLHSTFSKVNDHLTSDPQHVLDLTTDAAVDKIGIEHRLQKEGVVLMIHSETELAQIMADLLNKLLLMRIAVLHTKITTKYGIETITMLKDEFALLVNTNHPSLQSRLREALKSAALRMSRERKFCVELDISRCIHDWYAEQQGAITSCDDIHQLKVRHTRIYVTNHSIPCHVLYCRPHWWLCLCVCWLLAAPGYKCYRRLTCTDIHIDIRGEITQASSIQDEDQC